MAHEKVHLSLEFLPKCLPVCTWWTIILCIIYNLLFHSCVWFFLKISDQSKGPVLKKSGILEVERLLPDSTWTRAYFRHVNHSAGELLVWEGPDFLQECALMWGQNINASWLQRFLLVLHVPSSNTWMVDKKAAWGFPAPGSCQSDRLHCSRCTAKRLRIYSLTKHVWYDCRHFMWMTCHGKYLPQDIFT